MTKEINFMAKFRCPCGWSGDQPDESDASDVDPDQPWRIKYVTILYCPNCHQVIK